MCKTDLCAKKNSDRVINTPSSNINGMKPRILDLGYCKRKRLGAIGVDYSNSHNADIVHDLNDFPYPFENESVDQIYMDNVLEHLDNPLGVMEEIYRITKPDVQIKVIVLYFRSVWTFIGPTHKTFSSV